MTARFRFGVLAAAFAVVGVLALACGDDGGGSASIPPAKRTFHLAAVEPKGSASVDSEPFPAEALPDGGGYALKEPKDGKWEVETYQWAPASLVVFQGDEVELEIIGINGSRHDATVEGYVDSFVVERGKLTHVNFVADQAGTFQMVCKTHQPSMTAQIVVLPRS